MDEFFSKYGWTVIEMICSFFVVFFFFSIYSNTDIKDNQLFSYLGQQVRSNPIENKQLNVDENSFNVISSRIEKDSKVFDWKKYIVINQNDINLIDYIDAQGVEQVDISKPGQYEVVYNLLINGILISKKGIYTVV